MIFPRKAPGAGRIDDDVANTLEAVNQRVRLRAVAPLPGCRDHLHRQPQCMDGVGDLGRQAATRTPDAVGSNPPSARRIRVSLADRAVDEEVIQSRGPRSTL